MTTNQTTGYIRKEYPSFFCLQGKDDHNNASQAPISHVKAIRKDLHGMDFKSIHGVVPGEALDSPLESGI